MTAPFHGISTHAVAATEGVCVRRHLTSSALGEGRVATPGGRDADAFSRARSAEAVRLLDALEGPVDGAVIWLAQGRRLTAGAIAIASSSASDEGSWLSAFAEECWPAADVDVASSAESRELEAIVEMPGQVRLAPAAAPMTVGFLASPRRTPDEEADTALSLDRQRAALRMLVRAGGALAIRWSCRPGASGRSATISLSGAAANDPLCRAAVVAWLRTLAGTDTPLAWVDVPEGAQDPPPTLGNASACALGALLCMPPVDDEQPLPVVTRRCRNAPPDGLCGDGAPLGRSGGVEVRLDREAACRHTYVLGQTGAGKSTLLLRQILHDIDAGESVVVLDPHGSLVADVAARVRARDEDRVVYWNMADTSRPFPFNFLAIDDEDDERYRRRRDLVIDDLQSYIASRYQSEMRGPIFETHFRTMLTLLMGSRMPEGDQVPALSGLAALYRDKPLRTRAVEGLADEDRLTVEMLSMLEAAGYDQSFGNIAPYIVSKLNHFLVDEAVVLMTCQDACLDIGRLIEGGKVLLVDLGRARLGDVAAGMLASQLVTQIRGATMSRGPGVGREVRVYADEFQVFANERIGELLSEARKFGVGLTLSHQFLAQLPESVLGAVLGNVGTSVVFRVGAQDGATLAPLFEPRFDGLDLHAQPDFHACVRSCGSVGAMPFSVTTCPPEWPACRERAQRIRDRSIQRYGISRADARRRVSRATPGGRRRRVA